MNLPIPIDAISACGDSFYSMVLQFCGMEVCKLLRFLRIESSMDLLETDEVFSILQLESIQTESIKELIGLSSRNQLGNYTFFVFPGIQIKLERFIHSLRSLLSISDYSPLPVIDPPPISADLVKRYPFLMDLISCLKSGSLTEFSIEFISNLSSNWASAKTLYRFNQSVNDFASSLYILGGRSVYEFIRVNIPGSLPSLSTLNQTLASSKFHLIEGEFQYDRLMDSCNMFGCTYAFCGEDSTSVVPRTAYDTRSNNFVGFTLPLKNGCPSPRRFSTDSLNELEAWHSNVDKSSLLHAHVVQALPIDNQRSPPSPFLLAAYGTNGKYTAQDIMNRWSTIFDSCLVRNIRIIGFAADCDPKNLKAMRDSMGFFSNERTRFNDHPACLEISSAPVSSQNSLVIHEGIGEQFR